MTGFAPVAEGFTPPGPGEFDLPPIFGDSLLLTKPALQLVLAAVMVFGFFYVASRRRAMVPGRLQYAGEQAYGFVRNGIARDVIGSQEFMKFVPGLVALFFFILLNNLFGILPFFQFPTFSRAGFVYALAALCWITYNAVGIRRHGWLGYLKHVTVPGDIRGWILIILAPLEFISTVLVRPLTLSWRLLFNMFAGHLLLLLFTLGGEYLLLEADQLLYRGAGVITILMALAISFLELFVQVIQAFVFTLLTAIYIQGALAEEH